MDKTVQNKMSEFEELIQSLTFQKQKLAEGISKIESACYRFGNYENVPPLEKLKESPNSSSQIGRILSEIQDLIIINDRIDRICDFVNKAI